MPVEGSDNTVLDRDVQSRLLAIYNRNNNPTSYAGSFAQALAETRERAQAIIRKLADGETLSNDDVNKFKTVCKAVEVGTDGWISDIQSQFPAPRDSEVSKVLDSLNIYKAQLLEVMNCANTINAGSGGDHFSLLTAHIVACNFANATTASAGIERQAALLATPLNCAINAITSVLIDYVAGWATASIRDEKVLDFFDFNAVKGELAYGQIVADALGECIKSFIPFLAKSKVADALASGIIGAVSGLSDNLYSQYESNSKKYSDLTDVIKNIDFSDALQKSGTNAVTNVVANVLGNKLTTVLTNKLSTKGFTFVKGLLKRCGLSEEASNQVLKKLGADEIIANYIRQLRGAGGLIGKDFENFLTNKLPSGSGGFSVGGRDFDVAYDSGMKWVEAKSGRYWLDQVVTEAQINKFKSDMGSRLSIAQQNGVSYELFSNSSIPTNIKSWLTSKGIKFYELLN